MLRRKKIWKGLALAVAVIMMAEGAAKLSVQGAAGNGGQQMRAVSSELGDTGTEKSAEEERASGGNILKNIADKIKSIIPGAKETTSDTEKDDAADSAAPGNGTASETGSPGADTGADAPGNNAGEAAGTDSDSGNGTGSGNGTQPDGSQSGGAGETQLPANPGTGEGTGNGPDGTPGTSEGEGTEKPKDTTDPDDGDQGKDPEKPVKPEEGADGAGSGTGEGGSGTDSGTGEGGDGTGSGTGEGGDGTGSGTGGDGDGTGSGTGGDGSGTDSGTGGNGDGTDSDDGQQKYEIEIDGKKVTFDDFAEVWDQHINGKSITVRLEDHIKMTSSANAKGTLCKLTNGDVTLDLNGYNLTYPYPASRSASGSQDLIGVTGGTLTIEDSKGSGTIAYTGNGNYSGACVFASGGTVTIKSGTFRSNVSAPINIESGATLNIEGGTFYNTGTSGSAITVNNGKLDMSGGKVASGSLTLYKKDGGLNVSLGVGSEFSEIRFTGSENGSVREALASDCGFRSSSSGNWVTEENRLSASSIQNVKVDKKPIRFVKLSAVPASNKVQFSYTGGTEFTLSADAEMADGSSDLKYEWYRTYNDGVEEQIQNTENIYRFSTAGYDAGTYVYHVCAKSGDYEERDSFTLTIDPLPGGTITNNTYQTEYTYGDFAAPPQNGAGVFKVEPAIPETANVKWTYKWYKDSVSDDHTVNTPTDVGTYILRVEAGDANYQAVGEIPVSITQRTVTPVVGGTTAKVYDGTTEAKDVQVALENVASGDTMGVGVKAASIAYNDANVSLANRIVASGIELTGNKAGNYVLSSTEASTEATISKAQLHIQLEVSPSSEKINRPVTVTLTVLNSDDSPMDNNGLKAEDITLFVSGRNDTEEEHTLPLKASGSRYGVYTAEYTTSIKGDKTFTAEITGNANYEVSNMASDNSLTIFEKTAAVMKLTASETEDVVYGDEVTYTAVVAKENEDDEDALSGNVQFYEDEISDDHKLGSAKRITKSGEKASITLDDNVLTAGDHKILAVFSESRSYEDASAEVSTTVAKKQLTWDTSGLSASKAAGTAGEATVYGELKLDGLEDEEDVTFKQPGVMKTNGLKSTEAGSYKVTVVSDDKEWKFDPKEPENYELPESDPEMTAKVNAVKELPNPPADTEDGKKFKLIMEEGISTVPEGLKNTSFNTPAKIEEELRRVLTESGVFRGENTAIYDVVLQVSTDEGTTWEVADYSNFPSEGLKVTLPYPGGTGRYTNNFAVAHMFASSYFGKTSGQVEFPSVKKTDNGMEFTVTGLSPIGLAWGGPMDVLRSVSNTIRTGGAATWDNNPILLYTCLAGGAVLAIAVVVTAFAVGGKKKNRKSRK